MDQADLPGQSRKETNQDSTQKQQRQGNVVGEQHGNSAVKLIKGDHHDYPAEPGQEDSQF